MGKLSKQQILRIERLGTKGLTSTEIADRVNVAISTAWFYSREKKRRTESPYKYQKRLVKKRFASYIGYRKHLIEIRQRRPENQELSDLVQRGLEITGNSQGWLAKELGVTKETISAYENGEIIPKKGRLIALYSIFNVPVEKYPALDAYLN